MKNFANLFSCIDLVFGTFYLPGDRTPSTFGSGDERVPESVFGQMVYPLLRR
jgi:sterol desaturase/sphingolipid hydroxylase (fatty acid hydroxylase superfamily)